jgi:hypothetical protein
MEIIKLPPDEAVRRFVMRSFEVGGDVVIMAPVEHLRFRRTAYYPYTYGETPQQALCDLGRFASATLITNEPGLKELGLIYDLAECALRDQIALFLVPRPQLLLLNSREAIVENCGTLHLWRRGEDGYKKAADRAREVAASARRVGVLEYGDIRSEYCRQFPFDVRC